MKNRNLLFWACILCMYGCGDDSKGGSGEPTPGNPTCDCKEDEKCIAGVCQKIEPGAECAKDCEAEGKTCINGKCALCVGDECFFDGDDGETDVVECRLDSDCSGDNQICVDEQCISSICDPACPEDQECVRGKCKAETLLWDLCNNQADCLSGECVYFLTPSKEMQMEVDGEMQIFNSNNPIPVYQLDDRINSDYYNQSHPDTPVPDGTMVGVCAYECTKETEALCPADWSCQVVAKGVSSYPATGNLPFALDQADLEKTPFAALCRPNVTAPYNVEMCTASEAECKAAGLVWHDGMCLESCNDAAKECPFLFRCEGTDTDGKLCMPVGGTCDSCYDKDGDGAGYGHCPKYGVDCDDDNPNAYFQKELSCDETVGSDNRPVNLDLNCNGYIDRFELMGNVNHCNACGQACKTPKNKDKIAIACVSDTEGVDADWYKTASADDDIPEFHCEERCAFGFGDCYGTAQCDTMLLTDDGMLLAKADEVQIAARMVNAANAVVYARDDDGDGYPGVDIEASRNSGSENNPNQIIFDASNTVICCGENTEYCYSADKAWQSISLSETTKEIEAEDGTMTTIYYRRPRGKDNDECDNSPQLLSCYDGDDDDPEVNPGAVEKCDGKDNDGSRIVLNKIINCSEWCADTANNCTSFEVKNTDAEGNETTTYKINPYCDATPDGSQETKPMIDQVTGDELTFGMNCTKYHASGEVCSDQGTVSCMEKPEIRCAAGSDNCACGVNSTGAFIITAKNTTTDPETGSVTYKPANSDYVRISRPAEFCHCNNTSCTKSNDDNCEGKDSPACYELCGRVCNIHADYALACSATTDARDGLDDKDAIAFDGLDNNCNGLVDEDAWKPCIFTRAMDVAYYEAGKDPTGHAFKKGVDFKVIEPAADNNEYINDDSVTNIDKSLNLCRLGILKSRAVVSADGKTEYEELCKPIYKPRKFDFYGDGIDSNCDGADYDIKNTVFVGKSGQGSSLCSDDNNTCKYVGVPAKNPTTGEQYTEYVVSPCCSIAAAVQKAEDSKYKQGFYHDIIVQNISLAANSGITLPTYSTIKKVQNLIEPDASGLPDVSGQVHDGRFISAYGLHRYFVDQYRKNPNFDASLYRFAYWNKRTVGHDTFYDIPKNAEITQPEEVIRIFGGFERMSKEKTGCSNGGPLATSCDYWGLGESAGSSSLDVTVTPDNNKRAYAIFYQPKGAPLSLRLTNLKLALKSNPLSNQNNRNRNLAGGVTMIGINGSHGAKILSLDKTTINVEAPAGYSFATNDKPPADQRTGFNIWGGFGNNTRGFSKCSGSCWDYVNAVNGSPNRGNQTVCGYGLDANRMTQSTGGMGGSGVTCGNNCESRTGRPAFKAQLLKDGKLEDSNETGARGNGGEGHYGGSCDRKTDPASDSSYGENGGGGKAGKTGDGSQTKMYWAMSDNDGIYVESDRSLARGWYGQPGGGGGGSGVDRCWKGNGSECCWCYGALGGSGGCGGRGGEAGGTGGSALGIVLASTPAGSAKLNLLTPNNGDNMIVTVSNGDGGTAQYGGNGANGQNGAQGYSYAREGYTNADTQCHRVGGGGGGGGGGAGGLGGGGKAGWAYPYIFLCDNSAKSLKNPDKFRDNCLTNLSTCGFDIPADMVEFVSAPGRKYGEQNLDGLTLPNVSLPNDKIGVGTRSLLDLIATRGGSNETFHSGRSGGKGGVMAGEAIDKAVSQSKEKGGAVSQECLRDNDKLPIIVRPLVFNGQSVVEYRDYSAQNKCE